MRDFSHAERQRFAYSRQRMIRKRRQRAGTTTCSRTNNVPECVGSAGVLPEVKVLHSAVAYFRCSRRRSFWRGSCLARVHSFLNRCLKQTTMRSSIHAS